MEGEEKSTCFWVLIQTLSHTLLSLLFEAAGRQGVSVHQEILLSLESIDKRL